MKSNVDKKIRKLLRDPKLFFRDMYLKRFARKSPLPVSMPRKKLGREKYTVVSAVYNVERYLEDFFQSLVDQRLDFKSHIYLIMVDDGSTDRSAEIIGEWQQRYPDNIKCIWKENGGQATARNLGMHEVQTEWVTFIDPDDFVDINYFSEVDDFIAKQSGEEYALVSCNFILYYEDSDRYSDTHPLKYRFAKGNKVFSAGDLEKHLQLSVNSVFFRASLIRSNQIRFNAQIRPNFEDAHFVGSYLRHLTHKKVAFLPKARYYYRKRADGTSTLDSSWQKESLFDQVLIHGCLDLMEQYTATGAQVPKHVQRAVLYHLMWYFKKLVNWPERVAFLSERKTEQLLKTLDTIFGAIDVDTIVEFELAGCWFFHKVGMLSTFKRKTPPFQIAYVERLDWARQQVLIRYFCATTPLERFVVKGMDVVPAHAKTARHSFLTRDFALERWIWLPISESAKNSGRLEIYLDGVDVRISIGGKQHSHRIGIPEIFHHFDSSRHRGSGGYAGSWLFMDRDSQADDNAEHLYRHVLQRDPNLPAYFVLREDSHDWPRLQQDGFRLIPFSSAEHRLAMRECSKLISSHADKYVVDPFNDDGLKRRQFVFLQHGVTKDDLSAWLNTKHRIDCIVTAAEQEYISFAGDKNRYRVTEKEVVLTGFPRHDALLKDQTRREKNILIMPTWRKYLIGQAIGGNDRQIVNGFLETAYARSWKGLLADPTLIALAHEYGYRLIFFPHANVQPYLSQFEIPETIEVLTHSDVSIQNLFLKSSLMITDYSSVAFEMAYLQRPVIYWQFDEEDFFKGEHVFQRGYFDYRRDGFGPVLKEKDEVLAALAELLSADCRPSEEYENRMARFFAFRDGNCCERVYQAILALDQAPGSGTVNMKLAKQFAQAASDAGEWVLAEQRWRRYLQLLGWQGQDAEAAANEARVRIAEARAARGADALLMLARDLSEMPNPLAATDTASRSDEGEVRALTVA